MSTRALKNLLIIRRPEFMVVEVTIFAMPILLAVRNRAEFLSQSVVEGALLFFVLYSLGDMINCLADRDLDRTYKCRLSRAVYELGPGVVRAIVLGQAALAIALAAHLAWTTGKGSLLLLALGGLFLGVQYSTGPFHFKSRGLGQLICLWLLLYFLPMLYSGLLVLDSLSWLQLALAASYATLEMGIILINTSEDYPEDLSTGVRTAAVALGLRSTLRLATGMVLVGGIFFIGVWGVALSRGPSVLTGLAWAGLVVSCGAALFFLWGLSREVHAAACLDREIVLVKRRGWLVPVWATMVGWMGVSCGLARVLLL